MANKKSALVRWLVRIVVVVVAAIFFSPLYLPMSATKPAASSPDDHVTLTVADTSADGVYQQLTLYRDGRNQIQITRAHGDVDIPDGGGWNPKRDKAANLTVFAKEGLIEATHAKLLFVQMLNNGVVDLAAEPAAPGNKLTVVTSFGGKEVTTTGPAFIARTIYWTPSGWRNRIRWQKLYLLQKNDNQLSTLMFHRDITLTND